MAKKNKGKQGTGRTAPDSESEATALKQNARYQERVEVRPIPISGVPPEQLRQLIETQQKAHIYDGAAIDGDPPLLAFRLRDTSMSIHPDLMFIAWVWEGFFGASLTITFGLRGAEPTFQARIFLPQGSATGARILRFRTFRAICVRRDHPEAAFEVVLPAIDGAPPFLAGQEGAYLNHTATFGDVRAHFWETLEGNWTPQFEASHHLSLSWMRAYRHYLSALRHKVDWWSTQAPARIRDCENLAPILVPVFALLKEPSTLILGASNVFPPVLGDRVKSAEFTQAILQLEAGGDPDDCRASLILDILAAHLWSSQVTEEGTRLPWLELPDKGVAHVVLDADALRARGGAHDYWQRILALHGALAIDWGRLVGGADVPLSPDTLSKTIPSMRKVRQGSTKSLQNATKHALAAAAERSETNAVERAIVPLSCGPLALAEFTQCRSEVIVVWRTADEEFAIFSVDPARGTWSTLQLWWLAQDVSKTAMERFEASARLLIAETIRDLRSTGGSGLLEPSRWQTSPVKVELDLMHPGLKSRKGLHVTSWVLRDTRPRDIYVYMKGRFGEPNGMMSALRKNDSDNLFHWQYNVSVEGDLLTIMASSTRVECRAFTRSALSVADQHLLGIRLKDDFRNHGAAMKTVRGELESWTLFANPFAQLTETILEAESKLFETPTREPPEAPVLFTNQEEAERVIERRVQWLERVRAAFQLSMTIRVMAPIWGEAFVNLVLLILQGPDIRKDQRLYDDLLRRQIDIRVRDLHRYCVGFVRPVDVHHTAFKNFLSVMNARNDLLHGNVDPTRLQVDSILFDGTVPLFSEQRSLEAQVLNQLFRPEYAREATSAIETVRAFTDYVLSCLAPGPAVEMRKMLSVNPLGYRQSTQRFGVLFGPMKDLVMVANAHKVAKPTGGGKRVKKR